MYMEALESEVESLSAEVTRLRLMLQRVTQVMEFPVSVDSLPSYRDPLAATLNRADQRATVSSGASPNAGTVSVPVELLQLLLEQQKARDAYPTAERTAAPTRGNIEPDSPRHTHKTRHLSNSAGGAKHTNATTSTSRTSSSSATASLVSGAAPAPADRHDAPAQQSAASFIPAPTPGDKSMSKEKVPSSAEGSTDRKKSVIVVNPVTADWRLPSPTSQPVSSHAQPPQRPVAAEPPALDSNDGDSQSRHGKGASRAAADTRRSQSDGVMPPRHLSLPAGDAAQTTSEEDDSSAHDSSSPHPRGSSQTTVSRTSRKASEVTMVSNSAWASAIHGYFDGVDGASAAQSSKQLASQGAAVSAAGSAATRPSGTSVNQSMESSQQATFSYSMFGSLMNMSPALSSVQARSASAAAPAPLAVADEASEREGVPQPLKVPANASRNDELPSSSHVVNSKKVPRQTSVMTYRSDDTDDDADEAGPVRDPVAQRTKSPPGAHALPNRGSGAPLAPAVLGARRSTMVPSLAANSGSPIVDARRGSGGAAETGTTPDAGAARPSVTAPGTRTPQHKKSVFDILREQGDDSSSSDADSSRSAPPAPAARGHREDDEKDHPASESQRGQAAAMRSAQELASVSYGTGRDAYSFYSPQLTPQESPAAQSIQSTGASLAQSNSYGGYDYDLGIETSVSRSRTPVATPGREDGADSPSVGYYYPI